MREEEVLVSFQTLALPQGREESSRRVNDLREIIGYEFNDPMILQQAFTHHSYEEGCSSLDRLAYIGDAILTFAVTKDQCVLYPDSDPGMLTRLRSANVDTEKLARATLKLELHEFLRHNIFLLEHQVVKKLLEPVITPATLPIHPVSQLQELCQSRRLSLKMRDSWKDNGVVEFVINDACVGRAEYKAKRAIAKNRAALDAYNHLKCDQILL
ncbi:ribonuclease 3-like protein 3 isoform X2 [Salvia hispanica]|uniref:ribonuclease 3-like protein 3 isoform X2 n=1 Tax=Salvia hispanica TaxID=49212 RepID=UPI0020098D4B|nr:ribonuclease 3-like protein 3 isoform X2 [Salvia hispanica]